MKNYDQCWKASSCPPHTGLFFSLGSGIWRKRRHQQKHQGLKPKLKAQGGASPCSRYCRSRSRTNTRRDAIGHCADLRQETACGVELGNRNHHRRPNLLLQIRINGKFLREPGLRVIRRSWGGIRMLKRRKKQTKETRCKCSVMQKQ